jgi:hypothetical protein
VLITEEDGARVLLMVTISITTTVKVNYVPGVQQWMHVEYALVMAPPALMIVEYQMAMTVHAHHMFC